MAGPWYVDSAAGGTADGLSWTNACTTIANVLAKAVAAGDTIYVRNTHSESTVGSVTWTFPGTDASPNQVICASNAHGPPLSGDLSPASGSTTPGGGAVATTTGTSSLTINGRVKIRGLTMNVGTGAGAGSYFSDRCQLELCVVNIVNTASSSIIGPGNGDVNQLDWLNTQVSFGAAGQQIFLNGMGFFRWRGIGSTVGAGAALPTTLISLGNTRGGVAVLEGIDLSALGSGKTIWGTPGNDGFWAQMVGCRLGASVTVSSAAGSPWNGTVDVIDCDSGATNYRTERYGFQATLTTETTDVRSGGASDGTTPFARKVVTNGNANAVFPFECIDIIQWVGSGLGSSKTASIAIMSNATLTNADIWPEVYYFGNASYPLQSIASGGLADPLASASNWATDGVSSWTTTGVSGPIQQTLSVSFTPQLAGYVRIRIKVAKASQTLRYDPQASIA